MGAFVYSHFITAAKRLEGSFFVIYLSCALRSQNLVSNFGRFLILRYNLKKVNSLHQGKNWFIIYIYIYKI
jgi:hypothetical protein